VLEYDLERVGRFSESLLWSLFLVSAFLGYGKDGRRPITSLGRELGYTSEEIKCITLLPDHENHPVRLLVEGEHPMLLLG
jgi:hypothetical protein